jgi:hypothetical protein
MTRSVPTMNKPNPEYLVTLVDIGLESKVENDRLLALDAANHFDNSNGTSYGKEVLEIFMQQQGLIFEGTDWPYREKGAPHRDIHSTETLRLGRLMNAVCRAIGPDIGIEMISHEYVGEDLEGVPIVRDTRTLDITSYQLTTTPVSNDFRFLLAVSPDRPFAIRQKCWGAKSLRNFGIAMDAISSTPVIEMNAAR